MNIGMQERKRHLCYMIRTLSCQGASSLALSGSEVSKIFQRPWRSMTTGRNSLLLQQIYACLRKKAYLKSYSGSVSLHAALPKYPKGLDWHFALGALDLDSRRGYTRDSTGSAFLTDKKALLLSSISGSQIENFLPFANPKEGKNPQRGSMKGFERGLMSVVGILTFILLLQSGRAGPHSCGLSS